jgi:glucosamine 6-phosphate synthetase-like amidotransferase/phosphosugar isomerase protein
VKREHELHEHFEPHEYLFIVAQTCQVSEDLAGLLADYIAVVRGLDVDQPRNLAKSVTVE